MAKMTDIVIIGGGPAGYAAAIRAAHRGAEVSLVESSNLGGTCLNEGCIPTKTLAKTAHLYTEIIKAGNMGIKVGEAKIDFSVLMQRKQDVIATLRTGIDSLLREKGVNYIKGEASLAGPQRVIVLNEGKQQHVLDTKNIIIATGARPAGIDGLPVDGRQVLNSSQALEMKELPSSLLVVGGGVIGIEMANIFARLKTKVTVIEFLPEILSFLDRDVVDALKVELQAAGVQVLVSTKVKEIRKGESFVEATLEGSDGVRKIESEKIIMAVGRIPNIEIKGLLSTGVKTVRGAIQVTSRMETNVPGIFAAGDVCGGYQLAHVAYQEGIVAAENCLGSHEVMNYKAVPQGLYTLPEVAAVGLTEKEARLKYKVIKTGHFPFAFSGRAMVMGETGGFVKIIAAGDYDEVVGASIIGPHATELIHEVVLAMNLESTLHELAATIHAHPTLSESLGEASLVALGLPFHST